MSVLDSRHVLCHSGYMVDRVALAVSWLLGPLSEFEMAVCFMAPLVPILHLNGVRYIFIP